MSDEGDAPPTFEALPFPPLPALPPIAGALSSIEHLRPPDALPPPVPMTPGARIGSAVVELVLFVACLGVFWIVWWVALWGQGASPARRVLKLAAVHADGSGPVSWRGGATRELQAKLLLPLAPISALISLSGGRGLWDRVARTTIVAAP